MEFSVAHLQNLHVQESIKRVRYEKNSSIHITYKNYKDVPRDYNLVEALGRMHKCPVNLGVMVIEALGEVVCTEDYLNSFKILEHLGVKKTKQLLKKCSYIGAPSTEKSS